MNQPNPARFFVYVANSKDGDISVFHLDARSGALTAHARVAAQDNVMPMALSPDRPLIYAATRGADKRVNEYAIDAQTGALAPRANAPIASSLAYLCAEPRGRFLLGASYGEHRVSLYRLADVESGKGEPLQVIGDIEHAHAVIVSADGRFAYASSLGSDRVFCFALEDEGRLTEIGTVDLGAGFGPRHLRFSPNGDVLYVLSEFRATVASFSRDAASGQLAALHVSPRAADFAHLNDGFARPSPTDPVQPDPAVLAKLVWAADIHVSPDGRFVYVSERTTSRLLTLRVVQNGAQVGALECVATTPTETQPRGFRIDPTGRFLVACGEKSQHVSVYAIDAASGALTPVSRAEGGHGANWVEIVAADAAQF
ncbi:lactonase family protein [Paraburkholderia mimosarum]|uniref:lactonase family protein n=1 Tax=Paraburkholderia mimosarum TaxID=312026 RepID=UPI00041CFF75|nr:beta-propeller fold lactonase family protein [Paraburkholderia mimosarum]